MVTFQRRPVCLVWYQTATMRMTTGWKRRERVKWSSDLPNVYASVYCSTFFAQENAAAVTFINPSINIPIRQSIHLSIYQSINPSYCMFACVLQSIHPSIHRVIHTSACVLPYFIWLHSAGNCHNGGRQQPKGRFWRRRRRRLWRQYGPAPGQRLVACSTCFKKKHFSRVCTTLDVVLPVMSVHCCGVE